MYTQSVQFWEERRRRNQTTKKPLLQTFPSLYNYLGIILIDPDVIHLTLYIYKEENGLRLHLTLLT